MNFNIIGLTRRILALAILSVPLTLLILSACGGGGGGGGSGGATLVSLTNGQAAVVVVGQINFASAVVGTGATGLNNTFSGVYSSGSQLYIPDYGNHRVLVFNSIPTTNGASASYALGEPDLTTYTGGTTATTLAGPQSPVISGGKLFVSDFDNSRIAIYNTVPTGSPGTIDVVAGQANKASNGTACAATGLNFPETVSVAGGKMVVADGSNNRVLIWNSIPTTDGKAADLVLGQTSMTACTINAGGPASASTIDYAAGAWTDGTHLVVIDEFNNRVLIWKTFPTTNGQAADLVLGQPDFTSAASGVSATTLRLPYEGIFVDAAGQLFVTDSKNNRVLVWNSFPTTNGQAADRVLGQPNFTSAASGVSATTLTYPDGVYVSGSQVFVSDNNNNRVLIY
jgi:hypothetical protein